ncbi:hypothetical protein R6G69_04470 [Actinotignum urinale]|nr:hypothetical protein [Actinotignum urinale]MDY5129249.1 hypothetical protein [Actinotignum urinale]
MANLRANSEPMPIGKVLPEVIKQLVEADPKTAPRRACDLAVITS